MHRSDLLIVNYADLEYFIIIILFLRVNDAVSKYIVILKRSEIKVRITINQGDNKVRQTRR